MMDEKNDDKRDVIKQERMDREMDSIGLFLNPSTTQQCKKEVVVKQEEEEEDNNDDPEYMETDSQSNSTMPQCGQEEELVIYKEEKMVFQESDGFEIYFVKEEPKEELSQHETGTSCIADGASELERFQQQTSDAGPSEGREVLDTREDGAEGERVQAASHITSESCSGVVFNKSRPNNSENGKSFTKHAMTGNNVGIGNLKSGEKGREEANEPKEALSSKSVIPRVQSEVSVAKSYSCHLCSKGFPERYRLKGHMYRAHKGERPYECSRCREGFLRLRDLHYHFKIRHRSVYKEICECGEIFTSTVQLSSHKRTCEGKKFHQCAKCEKQIPGEIDLTRLGTVHSGDRPFCSGYVKVLSPKPGLSKFDKKQPSGNPQMCLNGTRQRILSSSENGKVGTENPVLSSDSEEDQDLEESDVEECNAFDEDFPSNFPLARMGIKQLEENARKCLNEKIPRPSISVNDESCTENASLSNNVCEVNHSSREAEKEGQRFDKGGDLDGQKRTGFYKALFPKTYEYTRARKESVAKQSKDKCLNNTGLRLSNTGSSNSCTENVRLESDVSEKNNRKENAKLNNDESETNLTARENAGEESSESNTVLSSKYDSSGLEKGVRDAKKYSCPECSKRFKYASHLKGHMYTHTGERPYECSECKKGFYKQKNFLHHLGVQHGEIFNHFCECGWRFSSEEELAIHKKTHNGGRPYKCLECKKTFKKHSFYAYHMKMHMEKRYRCCKCEQSFSWKSELKTHAKVHTNGKTSQCLQCELRFLTEEDCLRHMEIHSASPSNEIPADSCHMLSYSSQRLSSSEDGNICTESAKLSEKCSANTTIQDSCNVDINTNQGFINSEHGKSCKLPAKLNNNGSEGNIMTGEIEVEEGNVSKKALSDSPRHEKQTWPFSCSECHKRFKSKYTLKEHMFTHTGEIPYECSKCKKGFCRRNVLITHSLIYHGDVFNQVCECGKMFSSEAELLSHKEIHNGRETYQCSHCEKRLYSQKGYRNHLKLHKDNRYQCPDCEKVFAVKHHLTEHMRRIHKKFHASRELYQCSKCGKHFAFQSYLNRHMKIHADVKPYQCFKCKKEFVRRSYLSIHKRRHERWTHFYFCECGTRFLSRMDWSEHKKTNCKEILKECSECPKGFMAEEKFEAQVKEHSVQNSYQDSPCKKQLPSKEDCSRYVEKHPHGNPPHAKEEDSHDVIINSDQRSGNIKSGPNYKESATCKLSSNVSMRNQIATLKDTCDFDSDTSPGFITSDLEQTHTESVELSNDVCEGNPQAGITEVEEGSQSGTALLSKPVSPHLENGMPEGRPFACNKCSKRFKEKRFLREHMNTHTGERLFECPECKKSFTRRKTLVQHLQKTHRVILDHICECGKGYLTAEELAFHKVTHNGGKSYQCSICNKEFESMAGCNAHKQVHLEKRHKCPQCEHAFTHKKALMKHTARQCLRCKQCFPRIEDFRRHMKRHTNENLLKVSPGEHAKLRNVCEGNPQAGITEVEEGSQSGTAPLSKPVSPHLENGMPEGRPFACDKCSKRFKKKRFLREHMNTHTGERLFECPECKKSFTRKKTLVKHLQKTHRVILDHICECGKGYLTAEELAYHKVTHNGGKCYQCSRCNMEFESMAGCNAHKKVHLEKRHKCPQCERAFTHKKALMKHTVRQCLRCKQCFPRIEDFRRHMKRHTNENLLKVSPGEHAKLRNVCEGNPQAGITEVEEGSQSGTALLSKPVSPHLENGMPEGRPFACDKCSKRFKKKRFLREHMNTHTGERLFECPECKKSFTRRKTLVKHLQKTHRVILDHICECGKGYLTAEELAFHKVTHNGGKSYQCSVCNKEFESMAGCNAHKKVHLEKRHKCPQCEHAFTHKKALMKHTVRQCLRCKQCFPRIEDFRRHMKRHTNENLLKVSPGEHAKLRNNLDVGNLKAGDTDGVEGNVSNDALLSNSDMPIVPSEMSVPKSYTCHVCSKNFLKRCRLKEHMYIHTGKYPWTCSVCKKGFSRQMGLMQHLGKLHGDIFSLVCECGLRFSSETELISHKKVHDRDHLFACLECKRTFSNRTSYVLHMNLHKEKRYKCTECEQGFGFKPQLVQHLRLHTGGKPFLCSVCQKGFSRERDLNKHMMIHTQGKLYECIECGKKYASEGKLISHKEIHRDRAHYQCSECGKRLTSELGLKTHMEQHKPEKSHQCTKCDKQFYTRESLLCHLARHRERVYKCSNCVQKYRTQHELRRHMKFHLGIRPHKCPECGKGFVERYCLTKHMRRHSKPNLHLCYICGILLGSEKQLLAHIKLHDKEKPYACPECGLGFTNKGLLFQHVKICTGGKPYRCSECQERFGDKYEFNRHVKMHIGRNRCSICKQQFGSKTHLVEHMRRRHTGERPLKCPECHKRFIGTSCFNLHMRRHSGIRPHKCPICNKGFLTNHGRKRHLRNVHKEAKYFLCDKCGKGYASQAELVSHRKGVTGETPYQCSKCCEQFSKMCDLTIHFKTHSA